jgi:site-specific DNA-adenine methylase
MKYVGSKNRLAKELAPIIQSYITNKTEWYVEPFVGGANMIDKIEFDRKVGYDSHKELIELLRYLQTDGELPENISEKEYLMVRDNKSNYPNWYVGLVGFCATFGAKYFGGYARSFKADGVTPRNQSNEAIRNLQKQRPNIKNIEFRICDFRNIKVGDFKDSVFYCDPPYRNTTKYSTKEFPYEEFYDWCRDLSKNNVVLVSEYNMPEDFECIWQKEQKVLIDSNRKNKDEKNIRVEKLFKIKH